ncbi:MAG: phosphomannomutase/phosphoglucomutase, partial [Nanoarchaeota archaeon]|nr:phosphomannomutase/phosphoglucomutase [Nanoarchaeota archaeon]
MGIFKAYDIRGIYPTELDEEIAYKIARAFVSHLKVTEVVVAMDCRPSSVGLKKSIIKGITDQGADVVDIGLSTTPMYYWAIANYKRQSGIMITASHNPKEYNGLKLCKEMAINLHAKLGMPEIKELFEKGEFVDPEKKGTVRKQDALNEYHAFIIKLIGEKLPFKVAVDCANGMSSLDLPVFKKLNCEVDAIFSELDGTFPNHEADPLKPANTTELQEKIKSGYDLGIAFDGDSDRVVFIDENGQRAQTDLIVAVLALKILEKHPGAKIVHDLRTSWIVADVIKEHGGKPLINRVGHSFLKHRMRDEDAAFAGELSGHLFYKDIFYTDNALYSALLVLSVMKETGKKL